MFQYLINTCEIPAKLTVNTESRRKVKISCALTVKLCTCVRLIKSDNNTAFRYLDDILNIVYAYFDNRLSQYILFRSPT